jgi:sec-independent protein translocase protein TatC
MRRPHEHPDDYTMSFGDHLDELRRRVILSLVAPVPLFVAFFFISDGLISWLLRPVYRVLRQHDLPTDLQVLSPPEFIVTKLKVSVIAALVLTAPWILWQAWLFIAPGLYRQERRFVNFLIPASGVLTIAGLALLYYVMLPLLLHVLVMFAANIEIDTGAPSPDPQVVTALASPEPLPIVTTAPTDPAAGERWLLAPNLTLHVAVADEDGVVSATLVPHGADGRIDQSFRISFAINFILVLMLGIAVAFQMPLVILLLGWVGLVTPAWLRKRRGYAAALCAVVSAIITPADATSMLIMLVPLYGLYELGIALLVIAPASRIAGRSAAAGGASGKLSDSDAGAASQPVKPSQPSDTVARQRDANESADDDADGKGAD